MPQNVSKRHKEIMAILRQEFNTVYGWPDPEVNIGKLLGYNNMNLRVDALVEVEENIWVAIEIQSDIHRGKQIHDSNPEEIKGRDIFKK